MELQKTLIDVYLSQMEDESIPIEKTLAEAIHDPQLFVFSELLNHPRVGKVNSVLAEQLRCMAFGTYDEFLQRFEPTDSSVVEKVRTLSVLQFISDNGWTGLSLTQLGEATGLSVDPLMGLLMDMKRRGLVDIRINEPKGTVNVTDLHVYRDVDCRTLPAKIEKFKAYIDHVRSVIENPIIHLPPEIVNVFNT